MKWRIFIWTVAAIILTDFTFSAAQKYDLGEAASIERKIFHSNSKEEKNELLYSKFTFYKKSGAFEDALQTLNRIEFDEKDSVRLCDFYFQKSLIQALLNNYSGAMVNVNQYCFYCSELNPEKKKLRMMVLVENQDWNTFNRLVEEDSSIQTKIKLQTPELLDPETYVRSASYLPGLGLMRLGYTKKGIASLGICVGALGFTSYNVATGFYVTSILSGFDPFLKFYKGGKRLTEAMVDEKNEKKASLIKQTGLHFIRNNYF